MKILEINKFYYQRGGSETHFLALIDLLKEKGHEPIVFSMKDEKNLPSAYSGFFINIVDFSRFSLKNILKIFYNYDAVSKLKKLIKLTNPNIAHLHNIAHHFSPSIIGVLKKNNIPVIQTLHDYKLVCPAYTAFRNGRTCYDCQGGKYYNCIKHRCHKKSFLKSFLAAMESYWHNKILKSYDSVDLFIAPSRLMRDVCVKFGIPAEKIKIIYNFLDIDKFSDGQTGESASEKYLLYFGRLSREKGLDFLIEAMKDYGGNLKLKIAGAGEDEARLKSKVLSLGLDEKINFLGWQNQVQIKKLIFKSKAVILPSICNENMPYSILESLALGKICIASNTGGIGEVINNGENGWLFRPGDKKDLLNVLNVVEKVDSANYAQKAIQSSRVYNKVDYYLKLEEILKNFCNIFAR